MLARTAIVTLAMALATLISVGIAKYARGFFTHSDEAELFVATVWLPFGVKLLTIWLYRAKAFIYLVPTFLTNIVVYLLFAAYRFDLAFILHVSFTNTLLIYVLLELARSVSKSDKNQPDGFLSFSHFLMTGMIASFISNLFFVDFELLQSEVWPIPYVQRVFSDIMGLFVVLLSLKVGLTFLFKRNPKILAKAHEGASKRENI